jgi:BirA family transcriptional regulator, biotin operon repressor / biotin---[acetyl-CoA-carboxylase] ligase
MNTAGFQLDGWTLHEFTEVSSTNLVASGLEAWSAVRADVQTAGRGRFQRSWVSDAGGLWLSAVLPVGPEASKWRALPLVIGLAVCETIRHLGIGSVRMRWPNDVLVQNSKLAGILVDRFAPELAVAGIGINVANHPEQFDSSLRGQVARLDELMPGAPEPRALAVVILAALRAVWDEMETRGAENLLPRINALWQTPRLVQLDLEGLEGQMVSGEFDGVDACGRLQLRGPGGVVEFYEPHEVRLFREVTYYNT